MDRVTVSPKYQVVIPGGCASSSASAWQETLQVIALPGRIEWCPASLQPLWRVLQGTFQREVDRL